MDWKLLLEVKDAITYTTEHSKLSECDVVILTVGPPVDEHLNPALSPVYEVIDQKLPEGGKCSGDNDCEAPLKCKGRIPFIRTNKSQGQDFKKR